MNNLQRITDDLDEKTFNDISEQYGALFDWFHSEYSEGTIRLDVHNDRTKGVLEYKLTVITGKEAADNQGLFSNTIVIDKRKFEDYIWMQKFINSIVPMYKKQIVNCMNNHYKKERGEVEKTFSY